jgi:type I restriction enzyme S subunit
VIIDSDKEISSWKVFELGDVVDIVRGVAFPKESKTLKPAEGYVGCLRTTNVQKTVEWKDLWYVPQEVVKRSEQYVQLGDILISTANSYDLVGKVAPVISIPTKSTLGAFISLIRPKAIIDAKFAYYQLSWGVFQKKIRDLASTTTNISNVSTRKLATLKVVLPPLEMQIKIVAEIEKQFSRLNEAVASFKRIQGNLKRYKAAVLKAAVEGKLTEQWRKDHPDVEPANQLLKRILAERRAKWEAEELAKMKGKGIKPKDDSWKEKYKEPAGPDTANLPELPEGWAWARAEQICGFITKGTTPAANKLFAGKGDIPFIKVYNLTHHGLLDFSINPTFVADETHRNELARSKVLPGDVLMNIVGPPLGKVSLVPDKYQEWNINQAVAIYRPVPGYNRKFLCHCLLTESVLSWATKRAKATAGQFNLTLELCRDLPLPLPPLKEQASIVEEIDRRLSVTEELEATIVTNLKRAERMRQTILQKAFSGELITQRA